MDHPGPSPGRGMAPGTIVDTDIPARLDRLPWGRFHTLVVTALGVTWILDGLEVTLVAAARGRLEAEPGAAIDEPRRRPCRAAPTSSVPSSAPSSSAG